MEGMRKRLDLYLQENSECKKKKTVGAESVKNIFIRLELMKGSAERVLACGTSIRQHTSAYVSVFRSVSEQEAQVVLPAEVAQEAAA